MDIRRGTQERGLLSVWVCICVVLDLKASPGYSDMFPPLLESVLYGVVL